MSSPNSGTYSVLLGEIAQAYLDALDEKSEQICKENLAKLEYPYPGRGEGDKRKEMVDGEGIYRLHIGRSHTAFYIILEGEKEVRVIDMMPIDVAHKRYD